MRKRIPCRCEQCHRISWEDKEPENPDWWFCEECTGNQNEAAYDRQQESLMEGGGPPTLREQQVVAYKIKRGL